MPTVSLREITEDNRTAVEALAVTEEQSHYVGSVTKSLQEAEEYPDAKAWYRAVYRLTGDLHEGEPILELDLYPA